MNSQQPLVSVLLPIYNIGHYAHESLDSLLDSSYENIEILAIDDFSKDDSWKVLRLYRQIDKRIKIYRNVKHYGKALTLNRLIRKAKGQYIVVMDGKDMVYKHKIAKQVAYLAKNEKAVAVATQCTFINAAHKRTGVSDFPLDTQMIYEQPLHGISLDFETIMIDRHRLPKDTLYFNPQSEVVYSDSILKLLQFGQIHNLPTLLQYRRTENPKRQTTLAHIPHLVKLFIQSIDSYDYRPNLRALLNSFRGPNLSTQ